MIGVGCFLSCRSLESLGFETELNLQRIEKFAFDGTFFKEVQLPNSICFIDGRSFSKWLKLVLSDPCSRNFTVRDGMVGWWRMRPAVV
jgi:hypothetical protein